MDISIEKALRVINSTKTSSDGRYAGGEFESGYHTIMVKNQTFKGQRNNRERLNLVDYDFKGKIVLDIGCNVGGMLHELAEVIEHGVGIDFDPKCINAANFIAAINKTNNIKFYTFDLEKENIFNLWNFVPYYKIDVCFFLALSCWVKNWQDIIRLCSQISDNLLFETNAYPEDLKKETIDYLRHTYSEVKVLSFSSEDDEITHGRVLLWCSNMPFEFDDCIEKLTYTIEERIQVRGIEPFERTGWQRKAYIIRGSKKDYFLGVGGHRNKIDFVASKFLRKNKIPVVNSIVASEDRNGLPYIIREYIESTSLAEYRSKKKTIKSLLKEKIKDILRFNRLSTLQDGIHRDEAIRRMLRNLVEIHSIKTSGYGFIGEPSSSGNLSGTSKTWVDFLKFLVVNEGNFLREKGIISPNDFDDLTNKYQLYFQKYTKFFDSTGCFLLGDINWSNVLITDEGKIFFTDLEFVLIGDPAFEFSCMWDYSRKYLDYYIKEYKKRNALFNAKYFRKKVKLYKPIKMLFISSYACGRNRRNKIAKLQYNIGIKILNKMI